MRLVEAVTKAEIAGVLASSGDEFYAKALRAYLQRFNFHRNPLDVALRKLLMDVGLPRETQQIDRVMEAFAGKYNECNPGLFAQDGALHSCSVSYTSSRFVATQIKLMFLRSV